MPSFVTFLFLQITVRKNTSVNIKKTLKKALVVMEGKKNSYHLTECLVPLSSRVAFLLVLLNIKIIKQQVMKHYSCEIVKPVS